MPGETTFVKKLVEGLIRFKSDVYPAHRDLFHELASTQSPEVMLIACSDSRLVPSLMLQAAPGELYICRNVGNIVPSWGEHSGGVSATIEYGVQVLKVKHVLVCGHTDCGAMKAALHPETVAGLPAVSHWMKHTERALAVVRELNAEADGEGQLQRLTEENVVAQLDHLATHPSIAAKTRTGALRLHGWVYDIAHGEFQVYDPVSRQFVPLASAVDAILANEPTPAT